MLGLARETAVAAAFGVGSVADAFGYASMLPSLFVVLLGGVNGPFHSAIVAACAARTKREAAALANVVITRVSVPLLAIGAAAAAFAEPLLRLTAPGLRLVAANSETLAIAAGQLVLMAPCAYLSGVLGVGFGLLSAFGAYLAPAASPALSSLVTIAALAAFGVAGGVGALGPVAGGQALAVAFTAGALAQCALQGYAASRIGVPIRLRPMWRAPPDASDPAAIDEGVRRVLSLLVPAALSSGMLQLATYTDLYFASFVPQAAAAMGYANLLVMAPLGVLSNALLIPALPILTRAAAASKSAAPDGTDRSAEEPAGESPSTPDSERPAEPAKPAGTDALRSTLRQCLLISLAATLPLVATLIPLSVSRARGRCEHARGWQRNTRSHLAPSADAGARCACTLLPPPPLPPPPRPLRAHDRSHSCPWCTSEHPLAPPLWQRSPRSLRHTLPARRCTWRATSLFGRSTRSATERPPHA